MKKGQILILGFSSFPGHAEQAYRFSDCLKNFKAQDEAYDPQVRLCAFDVNKVREIILDAREEKKCDLIVAIGVALNTLLPKLYDEIGGTNTVFWGVPNPIELGLAYSYNEPGSFFSGACIESPCPKKQAHAMQDLYPHITKILLPYNPASSVASFSVKDYSLKLITELRSIGFIIKDYEVSTAQEMLTLINTHMSDIDAILFPEGCRIAGEVNLQTSYLCSIANRYHFNAIALSNGAAFSYGAHSNELFEYDIKLIREFCKDQKSMALQPIKICSDNRRLRINSFMTQKLPAELVIKLKKRNDVNIMHEWINCPTLSTQALASAPTWHHFIRSVIV